MRGSIRQHVTYANVMVTIAVFLAMSGTGLAARAYVITSSKQVKDGSITGGDIKNSSLTSGDVRNNSLTSGDVRNNSLTGDDLRDGSLSAKDFGVALPPGPKGDKGDKGDTGVAGPPGQKGDPGAPIGLNADLHPASGHTETVPGTPVGAFTPSASCERTPTSVLATFEFTSSAAAHMSSFGVSLGPTLKQQGTDVTAGGKATFDQGLATGSNVVRDEGMTVLRTANQVVSVNWHLGASGPDADADCQVFATFLSAPTG